MSAAIAPLRIHRDGTSGDLVLTTPSYRPRLVGPTPVLPRRVDLAPRSSGLPAYSRATPARAAAPIRPSHALPMWCPRPATTA